MHIYGLWIYVKDKVHRTIQTSRLFTHTEASCWRSVISYSNQFGGDAFQNNVPHSQWVRQKKRSRERTICRESFFHWGRSKGKGPNIMSQCPFISGTLDVGTLPSVERTATPSYRTSISTKGCH